MTDRIELFEFTDGTVWTAPEVDARVLAGMQTAGNDTVTAYDVDETLDGGTGNDLLSGRKGGDTYIFGRGYGADRVEDLGDTSVTPADTVIFKADISPGDVVLSRSGPGNRLDLVMTIAGTSDRLTVVDQFHGLYTVLLDVQHVDRIEVFSFADSIKLYAGDIMDQILALRPDPRGQGRWRCGAPPLGFRSGRRGSGVLVAGEPAAERSRALGNRRA